MVGGESAADVGQKVVSWKFQWGNINGQNVNEMLLKWNLLLNSIQETTPTAPLLCLLAKMMTMTGPFVTALKRKWN